MSGKNSYEIEFNYEELKHFIESLNEVLEDFEKNEKFQMNGAGIFGCCSGKITLAISAPKDSAEAKRLHEVFGKKGKLRQPGWIIKKKS